MRPLYVHGPGGLNENDQSKLDVLNTLSSSVASVEVDFCRGYEYSCNLTSEHATQHVADLLVGMSMGGYIAAQVADNLGIPFVAMNPIVQPRNFLEKFQGGFQDRDGNDHYFTEKTIKDYPDMTLSGVGLILINRGDNAAHIQEYVGDLFSVEVDTRVSATFEGFDEYAARVEKFFNQSRTSHGENF